MNASIEIIIGVTAGVITSATLYLIHLIWIKIISPAYIQMKYQGADISGSWTAQLDANDSSVLDASGNAMQAVGGEQGKAVLTLHVKQKAHPVTGSLLFNFEGKRISFLIDYEVSGVYWEGYLSMNALSKDKKQFSQASLFLKLESNGLSLKGDFSFSNARKHCVSTEAIEFVRLGLPA